MTARVEPLLTIADWDAIPYDECNRYEIIEGELFVSRSPGLTHQIVSTNLIVLIRNFLKLNPIGVAVSTPGLILSQYSGVIPDIVYFSNKSRQRVVSGERLASAPDLVIEILSKGAENTKRDRVVKRQLYGKHGVPEYWIVDRSRRTVEIYRLEGTSLEPAATFESDDTLTTVALPGFSCEVNEIFEHI
jgi:Uma2 family endonuclease